MILDVLTAHRTPFTIGCVALAVFCGVLALGWPYLVRDAMQLRMRRLTDVRERDRQREKLRQNEGKKSILLRSEPSKIFAAIVERANLARKLEDGATVQMLKSAGYPLA